MEAREPRLAGVGALHRLGQLRLVAHQNDVAGREPHADGICERHLARLVNEQVVEVLLHVLAREDPRGAANHRARFRRCRGLLRLTRRDARGGQILFGFVATDLDESDLASDLAGGTGGRVEEVEDRLVAVGCHPDPGAAGRERSDHGGRVRGLPRAGRTLNAQRGAIQRGNESQQVVRQSRVGGNQVARAFRQRPRRPPVQQVEDGADAVATSGGEPFGESEHRLAQRGRVDDLVGNQVASVRDRFRRPEPEAHPPGIRVHRADPAAGGLAIHERVHGVALGELRVLVRVEAVLGDERPLVGFWACFRPLEAGEAVSVVVQLLLRGVAAVEEPPPRGLVLAAMVPEQPGDQLASSAVVVRKPSL